MEHDNISYAKRKIFSNKYNITKIFGITIFLLIFTILFMINSINAWTIDDCRGIGGDVIIDGEYCVNTFLTNSSFNSSIPISNASILIVAAGGGGGSGIGDYWGGGGGGGGVIYTSMDILGGDAPVIIGQGNMYLNGDNSSFLGLTAIGGGAENKSGGSGGGDGDANNVDRNIGYGIPGQGYDGGYGVYAIGSGNGGGGGGAGANATNATSSVSGNGGIGVEISINGSSVYYAGGGGGGAENIGDTAGIGGLGGGGNGGKPGVLATNGTDGLGGGGGGGGDVGCGALNSKGGSGIVIVRYPIGNGSIVIINSQTYNLSTYETSLESFVLNLTYDNINYSSISANLIYKGTSYAGTKVGTGGNILFTKQLDIPTVNGIQTNSFYWELTLINTTTLNLNLTAKTQTVEPIIFSRCNDTNNINYINFTYKDEMAFFYINASVPSANFNYWLGSGSVTKSYFYSTAVENASTDFCFSPNRTLNTNWIYQAGSLGYITRTFNSIINYSLTNLSTNVLYYLIQSTQSGSVTFTVVDLTSANAIQGARVTITRDIQGTQTTIADGYTDAAGSIAIYLSSVVSYTITASKSGCGSNTQTITPVSSLYTMNLNCAQNITKFVSFIDGVTYQRGPNTGVSIPGNTTFSYYVNSLIYPIISVRFELRDNVGTGALLAYNQTDVSAGYPWCNATSCLLTINYFTASGDNVKGRYYINLGNQTNYTYVLLEKDAYWRYIMINANNSQQAWKRTVLHFDDFMYVWTGGAHTNCLVYKTSADCTSVPQCKWLNRTEWDPKVENNFTKTVEFCILKDDINKMEFSRVLIIFFCLVILLFIMGRGINYEMTNPGSFVLFMAILIVILSIAGLFTFAGLTPWDWFNQYIYAYICVTFAIGYNLSIIRRYSA